jgi:hypothetical protein
MTAAESNGGNGDSEPVTAATGNTATTNGAVESHHKKHRTEPLATDPLVTAAHASDVTIHSVQAHAASGQVLVELHVPVVADDDTTPMDRTTAP